jgi:hypothetical protein
VDRRNQFAQPNREAPLAAPKQEKNHRTPCQIASWLPLSLPWIQHWGVGTKGSAPVMLINYRWIHNFYVCFIFSLFKGPLLIYLLTIWNQWQLVLDAKAKGCSAIHLIRLLFSFRMLDCGLKR